MIRLSAFFKWPQFCIQTTLKSTFGSSVRIDRELFRCACLSVVLCLSANFNTAVNFWSVLDSVEHVPAWHTSTLVNALSDDINTDLLVTWSWYPAWESTVFCKHILFSKGNIFRSIFWKRNIQCTLFLPFKLFKLEINISLSNSHGTPDNSC